MCNVGGIDRILRVIVGLVILSLVFIGPQTPWAWLGLIPLLTGVFGYCALYSIIGFKTCSTDVKE